MQNHPYGWLIVRRGTKYSSLIGCEPYEPNILFLPKFKEKYAPDAI